MVGTAESESVWRVKSGEHLIELTGVHYDEIRPAAPRRQPADVASFTHGGGGELIPLTWTWSAVWIVSQKH